MWCHASFEFRLRLWPLVIQNAEVNAVADSAGPCDYVAAQCAFFFRADAENCVARFFVERVGLEFDANASPHFEGVSQHQIFGFGVDRGALPWYRDPGRADLDAAVVAVDIHKASAADHAAGCTLDRGKDYRLTALLLGESFLDEALKIFRSLHRVGNPAEDVFQVVLRYLPEKFGVFPANRLQANHGALQRYRHNDLLRSGVEHIFHKCARGEARRVSVPSYLASCRRCRASLQRRGLLGLRFIPNSC